jgi:DNA-directed RNA polymerase subunit H
LKFDISKHALVPEHEILSEEELNALLEKYNITKGQMPKIFISDPVVKKIKANLGDVVKITRSSKTAGVSVFYRVVVSE